MAPIRVGFIGLGKSTNTMAPGVWGAIAHLPSLRASPHYEIVALCNSTIESAQSSIDFHKLGPNVKAYGSPEDIANDTDVDLILCSVVITKHYELIKPALLAGKNVFVEWPLAATTSQAEELTALAKAKNLKTMVGAQARADPLVIKIKELVDNGKIGKILSSTAIGNFAGLPSIWPESAAYYIDINSGGNVLTIYFGHFLDSFTQVLGAFKSLSSVVKIDMPTFTLLKNDGTTHQEPKTTPDNIFVQGTLESGAIASVNFRSAPAGTVSANGVRWIITGSEGEIEVTTAERQWQFDFPGSSLKLKVKGLDAEDVVFAAQNEKEHVKTVGIPGTNSARAWEAFALGESDKFPSFEEALEKMKLLDAVKAGHL